MSKGPGVKELVAFLVALAFIVLCYVMTGCNGRLKQENEHLREELAKAQQYVPLKKDTIRDTVEVVTQQVVEVEKIKGALSAEDKKLLKELKMKMSEIESYQKVGTSTRDTIYLKGDSTDTSRTYHDAWCDFELKGDWMRYSVRDSLAIAVKKEYKHRFLWWKWGAKGYDVKVVNFNPHSTIRYNTFVKRRN